MGRWIGPPENMEFLGNHGQAFWQDESYDHLVRSEAQFDGIRSYIDPNPSSIRGQAR